MLTIRVTDGAHIMQLCPFVDVKPVSGAGPVQTHFPLAGLLGIMEMANINHNIVDQASILLPKVLPLYIESLPYVIPDELADPSKHQWFPLSIGARDIGIQKHGAAKSKRSQNGACNIG